MWFKRSGPIGREDSVGHEHVSNGRVRLLVRIHKLNVRFNDRLRPFCSYFHFLSFIPPSSHPSIDRSCALACRTRRGRFLSILFLAEYLRLARARTFDIESVRKEIFGRLDQRARAETRSIIFMLPPIYSTAVDWSSSHKCLYSASMRGQLRVVKTDQRSSPGQRQGSFFLLYISINWNFFCFNHTYMHTDTDGRMDGHWRGCSFGGATICCLQDCFLLVVGR